jgi:putative hydrolase of the HAD superfamily
MFRAVVFDLWQTLATWPEEESRAFRQRWSEHMGIETEQLDAIWYGPGAYEQRETSSIASAVAAVHDALGAGSDIDEVLAWRLEMARRALAPDTGVIATLSELRRRGVATGLISNCTEDVALVWGDSQFAGWFDVAIFSATAGCMKPDRRIYELVLAALELDASECLFVGDGANDELRGAQRVGMTPVLILGEHDEPRWHGLQDWTGLRVASIPQILDMVG